MAVPNASAIRRPAVAGVFYPAEADQCRKLAAHFVQLPVSNTSGLNLCGAVVPHAGWICSGAIAGQAIAALAEARRDVHVVVIFGAVHTAAPLSVAALDSHEGWLAPGCTSTVAVELRRELAGKSKWFAVDDRFHEREHAVEVVLPIVQAAWPSARILPVEVPGINDAVEIGRITARAAAVAGLRCVYLASSDLTHYGPAYQFTPAGIGSGGLAWAKDNDRRLLATITSMRPEAIVPEVTARHSACGPGAIAAMMAACIEQGARGAAVLSHANSVETLAAVAPQSNDNAVGYAAVVLG